MRWEPEEIDFSKGRTYNGEDLFLIGLSRLQIFTQTLNTEQAVHYLLNFKPIERMEVSIAELLELNVWNHTAKAPLWGQGPFRFMTMKHLTRHLTVHFSVLKYIFKLLTHKYTSRYLQINRCLQIFTDIYLEKPVQFSTQTASPLGNTDHWMPNQEEQVE